ncbi:Interferon alpha-inducible protein 27, mitochondrial [Anabarilius grahami]|uniref:Interferon alpha-inducible protein 27, mitochondrial n=1 Tax=Anabarilius grahami TaxID=495550 RepID=A0A3N0YFJ9_ANAGA|nr:Interferon alpha-inducible protein 27, mitochondrial [Anabarilius grahami]
MCYLAVGCLALVWCVRATLDTDAADVSQPRSLLSSPLVRRRRFVSELVGPSDHSDWLFSYCHLLVRKGISSYAGAERMCYLAVERRFGVSRQLWTQTLLSSPLVRRRRLGLFTIIGVTAGAVGAVALAPVALTMAGFTSAGIAAGSVAASMMSSAAIANGGGVAAGSLVALLQSAAGAIAAAPAVLAAAGFTAGGIAAGSLASTMMSAAAVANGGGVAAGGVVATLQAAGAAGIPLAGQAIVGTLGAALGAVASMASNCTV